MIPVRDEIPTRETPIVNYLLIAANVAVFVLMALAAPASQDTLIARFAMVPAHFTDGVSLADITSIFTSIFMHAGLAHLGGNMIYLWIFGDNVEDRLGHARYLLFYFVGGVAASLLHMVTNWGSEVPTVGASGAIAAVLGAYLVYFPASRIATFVPFGRSYRLTFLPAVVVLGMWFLLQLFEGVLSLGSTDVAGVAFWAHVGGFIAGAAMAKLAFPANNSRRAVGW